jgi:hypothetical protein
MSMPAVGPTQQSTNPASRAVSLAQNQLGDHTSTSNTTMQFAVSLQIIFLLILPARFPQLLLLINARELTNSKAFVSSKCISNNLATWKVVNNWKKLIYIH